MSTADVLSAQREEINRCAQRREKLLRALFGVTQSFLQSTESTQDASNAHLEKQHHDLNAFLDSNDIFQNRFFDAATLPSPEHLRSARPHQRRRHGSTEGRSPHDLISRSQPTHHAPLQSLPTQDGAKDQQTDVLLADGKSQTQTQANEGPASVKSRYGGRHAKEAKDEGKVAQETVPVESQESGNHGSDRVSTASESKNDDTLGQAARRTGSETAGLTPPNSGRFLQGNGQEHVRSGDRLTPQGVEGQAGSQSQTADAPRSISSDPSQRLSRQDKDASADPIPAASADLPSRFIQDTLEEDHMMLDLPPMQDESGRTHSRIHSLDESPSNLDSAIGLHEPPNSRGKGESNRDPALSRRPPMRIDTAAASQTKDSAAIISKSHPAASEAATPAKSPPASSTAQSPPERTTTRLSSGALQHRSVSEILGETPRTAISSKRIGNESARSDQMHLQSPMASSPNTPNEISNFRNRITELKDKGERSKLSTVIFAKPQPPVGSRSSIAHSAVHSDVDHPRPEPRDYFLSFFAAQIYQLPRASPLAALVRTAHKSIGTRDHFLEIREKQDFKVLNLVKEMQHRDQWSLRQKERASEPQRPATQWDILLGQMRWMRTDFREERKFKIAGARQLADACAAWVFATPDDRRQMQVPARRIPSRTRNASASLTPDLVNDETSEITEDETTSLDPVVSNPPAAIFSLTPDQFVFGLSKSPITEKILLELPCYEPVKDIEESVLRITEIDPDSAWKTSLVPVSKYAKGKLVSMEDGPPRKRQRLEESDLALPNVALEAESGVLLPPTSEDVALFNPESRHVRDRIHAGHAFRPPSEYQMPTRDFFEWRAPSQWTPAEDDELRKLVREYSYNWSLISSCLTPSTMHTSGGERRTPWECFERWISLEGLPAEMSKVPYFRTYHQRLSQAARTVEARQQASIQSQGGNAAALPHRRRSNQPYTVEKRKSNRPIHLVDAMRKHAKKKEAALHKQQQQATLGAMRKNNEAPRERKAMPNAREMSRIKYERQVKAEEQNRLLRLQYANAQNAKKAVQQHGHAQMGSNPSSRAPIPGMPNGGGPNASGAPPHSRGAGLESRGNPPQMQRGMNGQINGGTAPSQGIPNGSMQAQIPVPMGQRLPAQMPGDHRLYHEAQRVQAEQAFLQQRQQHRYPQTNGHSASPNMQSNPSANPQSNPAMLASMPGMGSPSINGNQPATANGASPRGSQSQPQALSSGVTPAVSQIQNQVKLKHPSATPEEIQRRTTQELMRLSMNQQAMAAAVGNSGGGMSATQAPNPILQNQQAVFANGGGSQFNQQQYAAYMRSQQANQSRAVSSGSATVPAVPNSRSATPHVQRTGSAQGGGQPPRGPSQSPRPGSVSVPGSQ